MDAKLREAWNFHREWAGYSIPPGRAQCALNLARAELAAKEAGFEARWEDEYDVEASATDEQLERIRSGETLYLQCNLYDAAGGYLAGCGGIEVCGCDDPYCRVMEAELAEEALHERTFQTIMVAN